MNSNDWQHRFRRKVAPAEHALAAIRPGDRVVIGSASGEPRALVRGLVALHHHMSDTELVNLLTLGDVPYLDPQYASSFRANTFYIGPNMRAAVNEGRADYTPVFLSQVPALFKQQRRSVDVALVMVSPPDRFGYVSLGVSVDITKAAADSARTVIAQVNHHMPRTLGDAFLHVDAIDYLVPHDEPLLEWPHHEEPDEAIRQIAYHLARLVPNGATLQLGIGSLPDALVSLLTDKHDLGIHTEMISDGVMRLAQAGNITGADKTVNPGKIVTSFATGSTALFEYLDNNPLIEMRPSDYTNNPAVISRQTGMVAINAALEMDLTGQVVADSLGQKFYSGLGGHGDFLRGASLAKEGKPIVALPSTRRTAEGLASRIVANLAEGSGVVTTRGDVHYVVTEYGVAYLHGKTMRERAMSLINIAHPDFRGELLQAAKGRHLVYADQILPAPVKPPPSAWTTTFAARDGTEVLIRPIRPDDEPLLREMFYSFSAQTVYLRFHHTMKTLPHEKLQVLCNVDFDREVALVGEVGPQEGREIVALGVSYKEAGPDEAELAFVVHDDFQGKGLGSYLFQRLLDIGISRGIRHFVADVLAENSGMLKIFHRSGLEVKTTSESGVVHVRMTVPDVMMAQRKP